MSNILKNIVCLILAFLTTIGAFLSVSKGYICDIVFAENLQDALKTSGGLLGGNFIYVLIFAGFLFIFKKSFFNFNSPKITLCFACIFSLLNVLGEWLIFRDGNPIFFSDKAGILFALLMTIEFLGLIPLFFWGLECLLKFANSDLKKSITYIDISSKKIFLSSFFAFICVWGFVWILYGNTIQFDTKLQIYEGLGYTPLNDHNPFMLSIIWGAMLKMGMALSLTLERATLILAGTQIIFQAVVFAYILKKLKDWQMPSIAILLTFIFFAFHPFFVVYSFVALKDIFIACFTALFVVFLAERFFSNNDYKLSLSKIAYLGLLIFCMVYTKKTGLIILLSSFPFAFFLFKGEKIRFLGVLILTTFLAALSHSFFLKSLEIPKSDIRETLSIPLLQIARTAKFYPESFSENQKQELSKILPFSDLPNLYFYKVSDSVKNEFNSKEFNQNSATFAKIWFDLLCKKPNCFAESALYSSYGYWYPNSYYGTIPWASYKEVIDDFHKYKRGVFGEDLTRTNYPQKSLLMENSYKLIYFLKTLPIISSIFSIGTFVWLILASGYILTAKKIYIALAIFSPLLGLLATCAVSPVYAELRYAYAFIILAPVLFSIAVFTNKNAIQQE